MNRGLKIAIGIASVGVTATIAYLIIKKIKNSRDAKEGQESDNPAPPSVVVDSGGNESASTPFKNKAQGNMFREFVNRYYPSYAKEIDLSLTGDYNNSYIKKAWAKYGEAYKKHNPNWDKATQEIPQSLKDLKAQRGDKVGTFGTNSKGLSYYKTPTLGQLNGKNVSAYFYNSGDVSFTDGSKRYAFVKWWDKGKQMNFNSKNYTGKDHYNTAYNVFKQIEAVQKIKNAFGQNFGSFNGTPNGNLQADLDAPSRRGLDLDTNIID